MAAVAAAPAAPLTTSCSEVSIERMSEPNWVARFEGGGGGGGDAALSAPETPLPLGRLCPVESVLKEVVGELVLSDATRAFNACKALELFETSQVCTIVSLDELAGCNADRGPRAAFGRSGSKLRARRAGGGGRVGQSIPSSENPESVPPGAACGRRRQAHPPMPGWPVAAPRRRRRTGTARARSARRGSPGWRRAASAQQNTAAPPVGGR